MKKKILTLCCCILGLGSTTLFAQQGNVAAGGNSSGTGGSVSFSMGQILYAAPSGTTHNLIQGLQQPYEISDISTGIGEKEAGISLVASVFPNPSVDKFTLKVETGKWKNLSYSLYDANGKLLSSNTVGSAETQIEVAYLAAAHYFLKVSDGNQEIKNFKIIKSF